MYKPESNDPLKLRCGILPFLEDLGVAKSIKFYMVVMGQL